MKKTLVLASGGAGYIGSHEVVELIAAGFGVVILDNFKNVAPDVPQRLEKIVGAPIRVVHTDVRDRKRVAAMLTEFGINVVIHLAGKKSVGESDSAAAPLRSFGRCRRREIRSWFYRRQRRSTARRIKSR